MSRKLLFEPLDRFSIKNSNWLCRSSVNWSEIKQLLPFEGGGGGGGGAGGVKH